MTVDCTGSSNSVSNQSSLKYTVEVLPQETQVCANETKCHVLNV